MHTPDATDGAEAGSDAQTFGERDAQTSSERDALVAAARAVREHAHAPYSRFAVGAALRDEHGAVHVGANVENAAYPLGQCAEASAIGALVAAGSRRIRAVAVVAHAAGTGAGGEAAPVTPCGGCRQRLAEFADAATPVHLAGRDGWQRTVTLGALLPLAFGAAALPDGGRP